MRAYEISLNVSAKNKVDAVRLLEELIDKARAANWSGHEANFGEADIRGWSRSVYAGDRTPTLPERVAELEALYAKSHG